MENTNEDSQAKHIESKQTRILREELAAQIASVNSRSVDVNDMLAAFWEQQFNWAIGLDDEEMIEVARGYGVIDEEEQVELG